MTFEQVGLFFLALGIGACVGVRLGCWIIDRWYR
jgi:hypothetical protein